MFTRAIGPLRFRGSERHAARVTEVIAGFGLSGELVGEIFGDRRAVLGGPETVSPGIVARVHAVSIGAGIVAWVESPSGAGTQKDPAWRGLSSAPERTRTSTS